jgi:hypothetical protein
MLATAAVWVVVAVVVTVAGVRHYTGSTGCEYYECDWQFQLVAWFFRPVWWIMLLALVVALLVEYWLTDRGQ